MMTVMMIVVIAMTLTVVIVSRNVDSSIAGIDVLLVVDGRRQVRLTIPHCAVCALLLYCAVQCAAVLAPVVSMA
jgi:hypothetical protein